MTTHPAEPLAAQAVTRPRVLHFVTGGFSGATQVAIDLCLSAQARGDQELLLVLRRKANTTPERLAQLRAQGLAVRVVAGWSHAATIWQLRRICLSWRPDLMMAHGFSEHLWGRLAGLWAGVPHLVHIEHNARERYTWLRLKLAHWLARRTDAIVGVSEGVRQHLIGLGFSAEQCIAIPNGIVLERFAAVGERPWSEREAAVAMAARYSSQKDHGTLIQAFALLAPRLPQAQLNLYGGGKKRWQDKARRLIETLGLRDRARMHGHVPDMPEALSRHQVFVLSTHYEGMPLALIEAMACGCACIGTDVVGVREVIEHGRTGLLVPENDAQALAQAIQSLLQSPDMAARLGRQARQQALQEHSTQLMQQRYSELIEHLTQSSIGMAQPPQAPR